MASYMITGANGDRYKITLPDPKSGEASAQQPYSGKILPFSKDESGKVSFDSNAGLLGVLKRAVTFPSDAMAGKVDPLSNEGIARAAEMATTFTPLGAGARGGLSWAGAPAKSRPPAVPTSAQLNKAGDFGYDLSREMGVDYDAGAVRDLATGVRSELLADGLIEELAPKSFAILKRLETPPEGSVASLSGLDAARRGLGNAARDFTNPTEQMVASRLIRAIDGFIERPDPATVVAGPAAAAGAVWKDAKGNIAAQKRSDKLADSPFGIEEIAERRAAAANSGQNIDNSIRGRVASVLQDPKKRSGFSPEEIALLETVARGTATRNTLRRVGNLFGGGGGLGQLLTTAGGGAAGFAATGSPTVAAVTALGLPAIGMASKAAGNALTRRALGKAGETVRKRSPLYQNSPPRSPISPEVRALMNRLGVTEVMAGGTSTPQASPIDPRMEAIVRALMAPTVTEAPDQYEDYVRRKWAPQQSL